MGRAAAEAEEEQEDIVIVGASIGGLATALALYRKGLTSVVVYERSECLRAAEGSAIGVFGNGWRALDQLGAGHVLRDKAILLQGYPETEEAVPLLKSLYCSYC